VWTKNSKNLNSPSLIWQKFYNEHQDYIEKIINIKRSCKGHTFLTNHIHHAKNNNNNRNWFDSHLVIKEILYHYVAPFKIISFHELHSIWKNKLNPSKTQAVFIIPREEPHELPTSDLSLDGYSIPWSDRAKYLGLILDKKLTFSSPF
jgi:hypothetical protein